MSRVRIPFPAPTPPSRTAAPASEPRFPLPRSRPSPADPAGPEPAGSLSQLGLRARFRGGIVGAGPLRIQGRAEGTLRIQGELLVEAGAHVDARIETDHATLRGPAAGALSAAGRVRVDSTGEFRGEIRAARIRIEPGAVLNGRVEVPDGD